MATNNRTDLKKLIDEVSDLKDTVSQLVTMLGPILPQNSIDVTTHPALEISASNGILLSCNTFYILLSNALFFFVFTSSKKRSC